MSEKNRRPQAMMVKPTGAIGGDRCDPHDVGPRGPERRGKGDLVNPRRMSLESLRFAHRDLTDVILAQEDMRRAGHTVPKLSQYWDEFFAVEAELKRRGQ